MKTHFTVMNMDGERDCGHKHKSINKAIICANKLVWPKGRILDFNNEWLGCWVNQITLFDGGRREQCMWSQEVKTMSADEILGISGNEGEVS